jgi:hypothetical protein
MNQEERWAALRSLQEEYEEFRPFLYDVMTSILGFDCSPLQLDIALYLQFGPTYRMIQAQRGQAKTTITGIYAVWRLIHNPSTRVLIVSAGGDMASEISNWVIQIIDNMPELECLRADPSHGDRSSIEAYDVHWQLKGPEKSPSIASVGITSNMQGKRADILIADDIESSKNSQTETMRARLKHLTLDFSSICATGDIIYLGTPQSIDSVYNSLVSKGFDIRIWPGRFPTLKEEPNYGAFLAPFIRDAMKANPALRSGGGMLGDRGHPTDPILMSEQTLRKKEMAQGKAYFQLQHMLDTRLADEDRFPLKVSQILFMHIPEKSAPIELNFIQSPECRISTPADFPIEAPLYRVHSFGQEFGAFQGSYMHVDPAGGGQNGDETAWAVTRMMAGKVYVVGCGSVPGGVSKEAFLALTAIAKRLKPNRIGVEKNFGNGAFGSIWQPYLLKEHLATIEDVWESGQKELRIIDLIEPLIGSSRLVMDISLIEEDQRLCLQYPVQDRSSFSLFYQMSRITRDKGALRHDDRLDALAGACRPWVEALKQDEDKVALQAKRNKYHAMMKNPLGDGRPWPGYVQSLGGKSILSRMHRKF